MAVTAVEQKNEDTTLGNAICKNGSIWHPCGSDCSADGIPNS